MEFIFALIIFVALISAWVMLPSSKTAHSETKPEPIALPSAQQQV